MCVYVYIHTYIYTYIYIGLTRDWLTRPWPTGEPLLALTIDCFISKLYCGSPSSLYSHPPTCKAYPIAILLHAHCAIYAPPPTPLVYAIHNTLLVMAISCKGQEWASFGLYKIMFCFYSCVHKSIVLSFFRPACIARTVALLLHDYWAIYDPPQPPLCIPYTIQYYYEQSRIKAKASTKVYIDQRGI